MSACMTVPLTCSLILPLSILELRAQHSHDQAEAMTVRSHFDGEEIDRRPITTKSGLL
jgi:hypothetical protein